MITISTQALAASSRQSVMQTQTELAQIQKELSSGTLADVGLSLGGQSGQLVQFGQQQTALQGRQAVNTQAATRLTATSTVLDALRTSAQGVLSALTAATASGSSASTLQATAQTALSALTAALNTSVAGQYIFAGINSGMQPLAGYTSTSASKAAVDAAFQAAFGTSQTSAAASSIGGDAMTSFLDGSFASLFDPSGFSATWSSASNQPITTEIASNDAIDTSVSANDPAYRELAQAYTMISEFSGTNMSSAAVGAVISKASSLVNDAITGLTTASAGIGLSQNAITSANASMDSQIELLNSQASDLDGVDTYALTNRLSVLQTQLQASYELTSKLQDLSLTQYLS